MSARPFAPIEELPDLIVDSLLKQFAQSSQLGANAAYLEDLYEQYLVAPESVGPKWKAYFDGLKGREAGDVPHSVVMEQVADAGRRAARGLLDAPAAGGAGDARERSVGRLITAYRSRGHLPPTSIRSAWPSSPRRRTWRWASTTCPKATSTPSSPPAAWPASSA